MQGLVQQIKEIINETCSEVLEKIELEEKEIDLMVAGLNLLEIQRKQEQNPATHAPYGTVDDKAPLLDSTKKQLVSCEPQRPKNLLPYTVTSDCQFGQFLKVRGEAYLAFRLTSSKDQDLEKITCYNEFFTQVPDFHRPSNLKPAVYVLDVNHFLQVLYDEIRNIEGCIKYQEAEWKVDQAEEVKNKSYRLMAQLIEEILSGYDSERQVSSKTSTFTPPKRVRIRTMDQSPKIVSVDEINQKKDKIFWNQTEVLFDCYLEEDIHAIFPNVTLEIINLRALEEMRIELLGCEHGQTFENWRACKIKTQELGGQYNMKLLKQLQELFP